MADVISANLTAVDRLAGDLGQVLADLRNLGSVFDGFDGSMGSGRVEDALNRFHSDSSDAREKIQGLLERAHGMLTSLSSGARQVDSDLYHAFDAPPPDRAV